MKQAFLVLLFLTFGATSPAAVNYSYDDAGRLVTVDYGNGTTITYTYDKAGNLVSKATAQAPKAGETKKPTPPKPKG